MFSKALLRRRHWEQPLQSISPVMQEPTLCKYPPHRGVDREKGPGVWIVNHPTSTVSFQPVQVRQLDEELAAISGSLRPGQEVVALGVHLLHDGERVRVETTGEVR